MNDIIEVFINFMSNLLAHPVIGVGLAFIIIFVLPIALFLSIFQYKNILSHWIVIAILGFIVYFEVCDLYYYFQLSQMENYMLHCSCDPIAEMKQCIWNILFGLLGMLLMYIRIYKVRKSKDKIKG